MAGDRRSAREQYWRGVLMDWRASGSSIRAFCRRRGIAEPSFYFWRRELVGRKNGRGSNQGEGFAASPAAFVPVRVVATEPIEVVVRSGQVVRVSPTFDAAHLRAVVAALEARPC